MVRKSVSSAQESRSSIGNDFEEGFHEEKGTQIIDDIYMPPPPVQPSLSGEQTGQRLIIETMEIINFKSYGGRSILGPFHKSFNSIVGPNGSGKSNVIDSMLFVFGYRAQKLRSNKISSIIHNSELLPNCQSAHVIVNFAMIDDKGGDDHEIIENSRFSISRVVNKDNSSYYTIDGRRVQFKDVSKRLQECGIDLRYNRFLILQGEVEQISLMKPKSENGTDVGMLEYLEDIVGTSRYKEPIEKLNMKYNFFNEKRTQCVNRVTLCQRELKVIQESKCEAVRALELENKKKIEKSKIYQHHIHILSQKLEKYETDFNEHQSKLDAMIKNEEELDKQKQELESQEKTKSVEYDRLKKELAELKEKFNECNKNDYYLNSKHKSAKEKLKRLKSQIEEDKKKLEKLKNAPTKSDNEIERLEKDKIKIEEDMKKIEESIKEETENAQEECADLIKKRDELDHSLMKFKDEQTEKLNRMNEAHNNFMIYKQKSENARTKYDQLCNKMKKLKQETAEKEKFIERYQDEIPTEKKKLLELNKSLVGLEKKHDEITEQLNTKNDELLRMKRSATKAHSRDMVRNALMGEMRKGTLKGIFGRLGDLGAIDKKYDVAVSTACGRLKNFVVDTIDHAQQCVEFLKKNNLPTVTFIALDKLRVRWRDDQVFPENVPRLFDLVRVNDERIRAAFYYSLGDTLVANDLEQASRIAYGSSRYRVVTLKGEMIEVDGSMSGGGSPKSGGMGTSIAETGSGGASDQALIDQYEQEVESLRAEREILDFQLDNTRRDVISLEKDIQIMSDKLNSYSLDVKDSEKRMKQYRENVNTQENELKELEDNPEIKKAESVYEKAKSVYEKEAAKMESKQEELKKYDDEIRDILDSRLEPIKKKKKSLEKKLKDCKAKLNQICSERKSSELNLKKTEDSLCSNEESKKATEEEIESIQQQISDLEIQAKEISKNYADANEKCSSFESEFHAIQKNVQELGDKVKKIKNEKLDLKHEMEKKVKVLNEKREKVSAYQAELDSITLDPVDDLYSDNEDEADQDTEEDQVAGDGDSAMEGDHNTTPSKKTTKPEKKCGKPQLPQLTVEQLEELSIESVEKIIESIDAELKRLSPNFAAIEEYRKKRQEHKEKMNDLEQTTQQRDTYMDHLKETKNRRMKEFKTGFIAIARKLKELYRTITLGGDADLEFIDSLDPFSEGINFAVRPNKKSWKNNINLSGGEKTLASLALIFALHYYKPSPLYIMDEIDAALDFKNVSIIANYIKQRTRNTQFLIISLRNNMYELADRLIGIYKTKNITKSIPFDPTAFETNLTEQQQTAVNSQQSKQQSLAIGGSNTTNLTSSHYTLPVVDSQLPTTTHSLDTFSQLSQQS